MKNHLLYLTALGLIMLKCCEQELPYSAGFHSALSKNSSGLVVVHVPNKANSLVLEGSIALAEGEVEITLLDPDDRAAYSTTLHSSGSIPIYVRLEVVPGFWNLSYKSLEGVGSVDLHLCYH